jgi:hypothetical protein
MSETQDLPLDEGNIVEPPPDPWSPPRANYAQAASIGTGATGAALLLGEQAPAGASAAIALLPDPVHLFGRAAHVLGFQVDASSFWSWGLVLVVVSVLLNVYSFVLRYRFATWVKPRWDEQLAALQRKLAFQQQATTPAAKQQGFIGGDA